MERDHDQVSRAQQAMWGQGDFHRIGVSQVVVGELLVRAGSTRGRPHEVGPQGDLGVRAHSSHGEPPCAMVPLPTPLTVPGQAGDIWGDTPISHPYEETP